MKKINLLIIILCNIIFVGCSSKKEYFSPQKEDIVSKLSYDKKISQSISYVTPNGITLKDGTIVLKDGTISNIKLDKNEKFLSKYGDKILFSNIDGNFKIVNENGNLIFENKFPTQVVAASMDGDDLALVCANNSLFLVKISSKNVALFEKLEDVYSIDSKVASPLFIDDIVIYPALNGRLLIVHRKANVVIQDAFISTEPFFNNIIYLDSVGGNLYVATNTNLLLITTKGNKRLAESIKNIFRYEDRIYMLGKDGVVKVFDLSLNEIAQNKFKFAIFSGATVKDGNLYIFEKMGYVIKTDMNLQNPKIYKLNDELSKKNFTGNSAFYYDNSVLELK